MSSPPWQQSPFVGWPPVTSGVPPLEAFTGPQQTTPLGVAITLAGSARGGVAPYTYLWSVVSAPVGGVATFVDATNPTTNVTFTVAAGVYRLRLTVHDSAGNVAHADVRELVTPDFVLWSDGAVNQPVSWNGNPVTW